MDIGFEELWSCSFIEKIFVYIKKQYLFKKLLKHELMRIRPDITVSLLRREINFITSIRDGSKKIGELHINRAHYRNFEGKDANALKNIFSKFWMNSLLSKLRRLDRLVVLTEKDRETWVELNNVIAIPNPLSISPVEKSDLSKKRVIAVGRYCHEKGYDHLLQAWAIVQDKCPEWQLAVYGDGDCTVYEGMRGELHIDSDRCLLNGRTSDVISEFVNSSIAVCSSRFEGFGMAASDDHHDYVYLMDSYIKTLNPNYQYTRISGGTWEQCETMQDKNNWINNTLSSYLSSDLDLVTIQLGDNVNNDNRRAIFEQSSLELMQYIREHAPNARVVWMGSWYAQQLMNIVAINAKKTGCLFVDFRDVASIPTNKSYIGAVYKYNTSATRTFTMSGSYTDDANNHTLTFRVSGATVDSTIPYTSYTVDGNNISITSQYSIVTNSGVASHPGDMGFVGIANKVLYALGISDTEETYPYSI